MIEISPSPRQNHRFFGDYAISISIQAAPKIAAIISIVESCTRLKISVRGYLTATLLELADLPIQHLSKIKAHAWEGQQS